MNRHLLLKFSKVVSFIAFVGFLPSSVFAQKPSISLEYGRWKNETFGKASSLLQIKYGMIASFSEDREAHAGWSNALTYLASQKFFGKFSDDVALALQKPWLYPLRVSKNGNAKAGVYAIPVKLAESLRINVLDPYGQQVMIYGPSGLYMGLLPRSGEIGPEALISDNQKNY